MLHQSLTGKKTHVSHKRLIIKKRCTRKSRSVLNNKKQLTKKTVHEIKSIGGADKHHSMLPQYEFQDENYEQQQMDIYSKGQTT